MMRCIRVTNHFYKGEILWLTEIWWKISVKAANKTRCEKLDPKIDAEIDAKIGAKIGAKIDPKIDHFFDVSWNRWIWIDFGYQHRTKLVPKWDQTSMLTSERLLFQITI